MLVSHSHQFIYTKTYKTASSSVEAYFEPYCQSSHQNEGIVGYRGNSKQKGEWYNHQPARDIKSRLGEDVWNQYFKFCTVRHPMDKLVSAYFFQRARMQREGHSFRLKNAIRKNLLKRPDFYPDPDDEPISGFKKWLSQGAFWDDKKAFMLNGEFALDDFIRFEHLKTDLNRVCEKLDIPFRPEELKHLKGKKRPSGFSTHDFFDEPTKKLVRERYHFEIQFFGYQV